MGSRYIPNEFPELFALGNTDDYLKAALEDIVKNYPPLGQADLPPPKGLWSGPTGTAYLFHHISAAYPDLLISGRHASAWAKAYLEASRAAPQLPRGGCGIADEKIVHAAVTASITKDPADVQELLSNIPEILAGDDPDEILHGRAGALYLLRMVRHWVPASAGPIDDAVAQVGRQILARGPDWTWHGRRFLGATHGDVGIVAQLALSAPSLAPELAPALDRILGWQLPGGNWPDWEGKPAGGVELVQFCHGAAGFVYALLALRPHFPGLRVKIDAAVERARECIWTRGLLRKEPNLCHGIFGNGLALPPGPRRDHFLALATPEKISELRSHDSTLFEPADYGKPYATVTGYAPGAAWTWLVYQDETPSMIGFNDV